MSDKMHEMCRRIEEARAATGLSREKVAQRLNVSSRTIERWEKCVNIPSDGDLALLADVLGVSPDWLRTGEGEIKAEDPDAVAIEALSALVRMMPDAVCLLDEELRFIAYNEAYLRLWQVERDDITGLTMYDIFPDVSPEGRVRIQRVLAGESIYLGEPEPYTWRRADDSVWWCRLRMFPWRRDRDNSVGGMVVICAASMSPDDVPHIGMVPIEKSASGGEILPDSGVDRSAARGYDSGSIHSQGEDMQLPTEFVTSMAAAAVAVAIDPEAFRDITQKMMRKGRYRLRIIAEPVDKEPPPPKG